jgi:hypothetical protein
MTCRWDEFSERASGVLRDALANRISLEQATEFFENADAITRPVLREYILKMIWEIDGSRKYYIELMELFGANLTEDEFWAKLKL